VPLAPWNVTLCQVTISAQRAWNDDHDEQVETTSRDARLSVGTSVHSHRTPQLTVGQWVSASCGSCGSVGQWVMRVSGSVGQWVMRSVGHAGHGSNFSTHLDGSVGSSATIAMIH